MRSLPVISPPCVHSRIWPAAAVLLGLLALGGCSNDPNPRPLHTKRPDGSPWLVRYGGMPDEPRSLDPQFAYEQTSNWVIEPIYEGLLQYKVMKTDPYEVEPCLLTKMPERVELPGGKIDYNCELKQGILFQDDPCFPGGVGREVVAEDVAFSFKRICDPKIECPIFGPMADAVTGFSEAFASAKKNGQFNYDQPLAGVEIVDRYHFKFHLDKPYPQLVYWMATHFTSPVAREAVTYYDGKEHPDGPHGETVVRPDFRWHPVGQGPFSLVEYIPGQRVRLIRNPKYHATVFPSGGWPPEKEALNRPLAGHALPFVDEVELTIFREALPIFVLTRQGYLDGMGVSKDAFNSVLTPMHELSPKYRAMGMTLEKDVEPSTFFMTLNMQDKQIGSNKKLRQALSCAYDRQGMIDIFYNGVPTVAEQLLPPGVAGFHPDFHNPYGFNLEKARKLLAEAGYPDGIDPKTHQPLKITMDCVASGGDERLLAEYEQRQFQQLGIEVQVIENNFPRMLEKEDQGNFQIGSGSGWMADYPDPENFFFLLYSKNIPPEGKNASRYINPEFDKLFEKMAAMDPSPERSKLIDQMNDIINEDCPVLLLFNKAFYSLVQPWAPHTHHNLMLEGGLKYAVLNEPLRKERQAELNRKPLWPIALLLVTLAGFGAYGIAWNRRRNNV